MVLMITQVHALGSVSIDDSNGLSMLRAARLTIRFI